MSSSLLSPIVFKSASLTLSVLVNRDNFATPYSLVDIARNCVNERLAFDEKRVELAALFKTIYEISNICYFLQYKDHYENIDELIELNNKAYKESTEAKKLTGVQLAKTLRSIAYQIELHHLKELREMTKKEERAMFFLKEITDYLFRYIVENTPQFEAAKWGDL